MKIFAHHDADGLTSAYFTLLGNPKSEIVITKEFGDVSGWTDGDIMVDMRPQDPNINGLVIDHHPGHPDKRNYNLIWSNEYPASYLAFNKYKSSIPKSVYWKLAIGLGGDNRLDLLTSEIIDSDPQLLYKVKTYIYQSYGNWQVSYYPVYKLLSSYVNALLRIYRYDDAKAIMNMSERPMDIIKYKPAIDAKNIVRDEIKNIMSSADIVDFGNIQIVFFNSNYRLTGYIATVLGNAKDTSGSTILAINEKDGSMSLRGDLALYYRDKLNKLPYLEIDGHPGFMGGHIKQNKTKFLDDLYKII